MGNLASQLEKDASLRLQTRKKLLSPIFKQLKSHQHCHLFLEEEKKLRYVEKLVYLVAVS